MTDHRIICGDSLHVLPTLDAESVDAIVCDPPYGLSFMGKEWDHGVPGEAFWREALRVAKPGAHLLAFGGTRTYHRLACAIEDAGWEIRDCLSWLYGSGFPKSHDVSKAMDKTAGAEREVIGYQRLTGTAAISGDTGRASVAASGGSSIGAVKMSPLTAPATDAAKRWHGWGTALKPAWEPIILARKPLVGTVASNVAQYGTGAINVDGCRIGTDGGTTRSEQAPYPKNDDGTEDRSGSWARTGHKIEPLAAGRWPANVVLDEDAAAMFPESRFFYVAKASRREREAGLEGMPQREGGALKTGDGGWANEESRGRKNRSETPHLARNFHPTVKPIALMRWLCRLVTPPNGLVLDPFTGSGSTGCAAVLEGFRFVGIEREPEYAEIARRRIAHWASTKEDTEPSLFDG